MHLQEHSLPSPRSRGKPIFPMPLAGQALMFSTSGCQSTKCDQSSRTLHTPISPKSTKSRCSCEGNSAPLTSYNRLLLPAVSQKDHTSSLGSSFTDAWLRIPPVGRSNYESFLLNGFPLYGRLNSDSLPSLDYALLSNARRKNATRETTSTLKAWLNDHKKNPYPTKSEKIMLAIVTKMTLTQVSTWFANARRRLKKENKMTWLPKKKTGDKKDKNSNSCLSDSDGDDIGNDDDMDIDITNEESLSDNHDKPSAVAEERPALSQEKLKSSGDTIQRPSVIRAIESPTFDEIRDRFKEADSPVHNLQNWVNGCFQHKPCNDDLNDFPKALTPPATPIENQVTTFSSQKLFEAYDANKAKTTNNEISDTTKPGSSYSGEPLEAIFSAKQPVFSVRENTLNTVTDSVTTSMTLTTTNGVITPQTSPNNAPGYLKQVTSQNSHSLSLPVFTGLSRPDNSISSDSKPLEAIKSEAEEVKNKQPCGCEKQQSDFRVQGLTTSRELEAVLALTNLHKT